MNLHIDKYCHLGRNNCMPGVVNEGISFTLHFGTVRIIEGTIRSNLQFSVDLHCFL